MSKAKVKQGFGCITARYAGPTDSKGARVIVRSPVRSMIVSWDHALSSEANFDAAVSAFAERYRLYGTWVRTSLPGDNGLVYVRTVMEQRPDEGA